MRAGAGYVVAAVCLGFIATWGSENLFWTAPPAGLAPVEFLMTWAAYALVAAAALSVVIVTGIGGWPAAFLGGALLGFAIEGAVVATMYDAFPAQVVWTPLAWHALITGLGVLALSIRLCRARLAVQLAGLAALGAFGAFWGLYWPSERTDLPGLGPMLVYLPALSLGVVAAELVLTRLAPPDRFGRWIWIAPALVLGLWLLQGVVAPDPRRLVWPVLVGATIWAMHRLGARHPGWPDFGSPLPLRRAALFPLAPLITALAVVPGWRTFGPVEVNVPVALVTGLAGLGLWLWLVVRAVRASGRPAPSQGR